MTAPPRSIVVAGGGSVALAAALFLRHLLPHAAITLIELANVEDATCDRATTLGPLADAFHDRIGIDVPLLVRSGATVCAGTLFERSGGSAGWVLPTDADDAVDATLFRHWLADRQAPLDRLDPGAVLAREDRVALDGPWSFRIDPGGYRALLSALVGRVRIDRLSGKLADVRLAVDGRVAAIIVDGEAIAGDWFVDAGGPTAPIAELAGGTALTIPDASASIAYASERPAWAALDRARTMRHGWITRIPGPRTSTVTVTHPGTDASEAALIRAFRTELGRDPDAIVRVGARRRTAWTRNILTLGGAAFAAHPIAGLEWQLVHSALLRLAELLPSQSADRVETREFNRRTEAEHRSAADFTAAFRLAAPSTAALPPSEALARRIDLFARRGRVVAEDFDPVGEGRWRFLLAGLGHAPPAPDPIGRSSSPDERTRRLRSARERVALALRTGIPYRAWHDAFLKGT